MFMSTCRPVLVAELERQTGQGEAEEAGDDQEMQEDVQPVEAAILLVAIGDYMLDSGLLQAAAAFSPVFHKAAEHPEQGVQPEDGECADQQTGHGR